MNRKLVRSRWKARRIARPVLRHFRGTLIGGLLMVTPLVVTYLVLRLIFSFLKGLVNPLTELPFFAFVPDRAVTWVALGLTAVILYLAGVLARHVLAGRLADMAHRMAEAIPGIGTIYRMARQATEMLSGTSNSSGRFKQVVIVDFPRQGMKTVGLVTGRTQGAQGQPLLMLYIPTAPTPTSGFTALVPESEVTPTDMSMEEAMKLIVSGGVVFPDKLGTEAFKEEVDIEEEKRGVPHP